MTPTDETFTRAIAAAEQRGRDESAKRIAELEEALRPFASAYQDGRHTFGDTAIVLEKFYGDGAALTVGDLRRAARALAPATEKA